MNIRKHIVLLLTILLVCSCSEDKTENFTPTDYKVSGKVEKGPFISGSTITLQPLDGKLNPLGTSFPATITDDEGNFDFGSLNLDSPYALLTTTGFFFNEVKGRLSDAQITLQAIVDLTNQSTVNVNILTHLKKDRLKTLVAGGKSYTEANQQAQTELLTNFALQKYANTDVSRFSITAGTDEAAALIVVSSVLIDNKSEAKLTESLAKISNEFKQNGTLSEETKNAYRTTAYEIMRNSTKQRIMQNIIDRYIELEKTVTVKDLSYFVDWDGNGIAGDELGDPNVEKKITLEKSMLDVPVGGGTYTIKITSNVPVTLSPLYAQGIEVPSEMNSDLFNYGNISFAQKSLDQSNLVVKIDPASAYLMKEEIVTVYSMDGSVYAYLHVKQAGDLSKTPAALTSKGNALLQGAYSYTSTALSFLRAGEALYAKTYALPASLSDWSQFANPPISTINQTNKTLYINSYNAIGRWTNFEGEQSCIPNLTTLKASLYYEMMVAWGRIGYTKVNEYNIPQITEKELFALMEDNLLHAVNTLDAKKTDLSTTAGLFFMSKDVPCAVLAKYYLYFKEYNKAHNVLSMIVNSGRYQLENSRSLAFSANSREMIYAISVPAAGASTHPLGEMATGMVNLPIATYTEVMLSMAECAYYLGNTASAKTYLKPVLDRAGISEDPDLLISLRKAWESELKGTGTYFAFLKRNELALSQLSIPNSGFLVWPIPEEELSKSYGWTQNPAYITH